MVWAFEWDGWLVAFWTYILNCADGRYYTGQIDDLDRRVAEHQTGGYCRFTSLRRPVSLLRAQDFVTRADALEAERRVRGWSRAKKEALASGDWKRVSFHARPPGERISAFPQPLPQAGGEQNQQ